MISGAGASRTGRLRHIKHSAGTHGRCTCMGGVRASPLFCPFFHPHTPPTRPRGTLDMPSAALATGWCTCHRRCTRSSGGSSLMATADGAHAGEVSMFGMWARLGPRTLAHCGLSWGTCANMSIYSFRGLIAQLLHQNTCRIQMPCWMLCFWHVAGRFHEVWLERGTEGSIQRHTVHAFGNEASRMPACWVHRRFSEKRHFR